MRTPTTPNWLSLLLSVFISIVSGFSFSQSLNIQLVSEDAYPTFTIPIFNIEGGISGLTPVADKLGRSYLYVASNEDGLKIYETDPSLNLIEVIDTNDLFMRVSSITQEDSLLYVCIGGIFGSTDPPGIVIVNVADPMNPIILDNWIDSSSGTGTGIVQIQGDYAFIGGMGEGLIILNVADPNNISFVSQVTPPITFPHMNNSPATVNARGMDIQDSLVYLCYDAGGIRVINCADIMNPVQIHEFANPVTYDPFHLPRAYNNIVLEDTLAYVAVDYCGLEVWSISDPLNAVLLTHWNPVDCPIAGQWTQAPVHTNELILQSECDLLFVSTGKSDLMVLDIGDPLAPVAIDSFGTVLDTTGTWGVDVTDENIYLTYAYVPDLPIIEEPFHGNWGGVKQLSYSKCTTSLPEPSLYEGLVLFPNPAQDEVRIWLEHEAFEYSIFKISGEPIAFGKGVEEVNIATREWSSGIYLVSVKADSEQYLKKLVVLD